MSVSVLSVAPMAPISQRGSRTSRGLVDALSGAQQLGQRVALVAAGADLPVPGHPTPTPGQRSLGHRCSIGDCSQVYMTPLTSLGSGSRISINSAYGKSRRISKKTYFWL
ncbi:Hypothetical predicted protein [Marmota monax]|uniref:Uncharacterized protein n=1 Tax=Marmota monax TaxID=9995 RepID=A0A5E4A8F9_MARMO|nr:Hypothetical predicted protein [Marmota monax]